MAINNHQATHWQVTCKIHLLRTGPSLPDLWSKEVYSTLYFISMMEEKWFPSWSTNISHQKQNFGKIFLQKSFDLVTANDSRCYIFIRRQVQQCTMEKSTFVGRGKRLCIIMCAWSGWVGGWWAVLDSASSMCDSAILLTSVLF